MSVSRDLDQTEARKLARELTESTGAVHVATTVPLGAWGGEERAWAVIGPYADTEPETRR